MNLGGVPTGPHCLSSLSSAMLWRPDGATITAAVTPPLCSIVSGAGSLIAAVVGCPSWSKPPIRAMAGGYGPVTVDTVGAVPPERSATLAEADGGPAP